MEGETSLKGKLNVGMVSLGCDKNRVDAELMLGELNDRNFNITRNEKEADVIIVNTCGFIESAKQESIDTILELSQNKISGRCKMLIASGCLAERYSDELLAQIPELDAVVGVGNYMGIENIINTVLKENRKVKAVDNINYNIDFKGSRILTTPSYKAYVKISEGCNNNCSYCIIPKLRGKYRSRSIENILNEVKELSQKGTREIILVAQDTTKYGIDLYGKRRLPELIELISKIDGVEWIRLMYCYPEDITDELINVIKTNDKVCKYIDMPIQHINDEILRRMRRISGKKEILSLIDRLKNAIPNIVIRTSIIVGFPEETEEQFQELMEFLNTYQLDRVGVFTYSQEEDTDAALYENQVDDKIKKVRQKRLINQQKRISKSINKNKIGQVLKVLIEGSRDEKMLIGRTYGDAPEIDGLVYIECTQYNNIKPGDFVQVKITKAYDFDLLGEIYYEPGK